MKNYFNTIIGNSGLLMALQNSNLEPLLKKAKEYEKKYEWLQAAKYYKKASDLALAEKCVLKTAEFQECLGLCFNRAASQVQTNLEYKKCIKQAIKAYEKTLKLLQEAEVEDKQVRINHANAFAAFFKAKLEKNPICLR
ncbi:MAG: hypothetical protein PVH73_02525 [Candidatus Bathyarchaeota archaeon]